MNPHESSRAKPGRRQRATLPMDREWLEQRALRYTARWETSAMGVGTFLERKIHERCQETGESANTILESIPQVVERLVERGYIDDRRFAETTIHRLRRQGRSAAQIKARLEAKGIPDSVSRELLQRDDPDQEIRSAWLVAKKRRLGPYCRDAERRTRDRERHLAVLVRLGFDHETAARVIDAVVTMEAD